MQCWLCISAGPRQDLAAAHKILSSQVDVSLRCAEVQKFGPRFECCCQVSEICRNAEIADPQMPA